MSRTPDDPDANLFYVTKYGIKMSAMPGWDNILSDDDIWKTILFVKNSEKMKNLGQQQNPQDIPNMNNSKHKPSCEPAAMSSQLNKDRRNVGCANSV